MPIKITAVASTHMTNPNKKVPESKKTITTESRYYSQTVNSLLSIQGKKHSLQQKLHSEHTLYSSS